ncbi:MAG: CvpA family protein [Clostridia bacterium]|nr:CvpA family protein [Clostridia bacterium]
MGILPVIIDLVLVSIFIGAILKGRSEGFVRTVLSVIAAIAGILIAKEYCEPVALWIEEHFIRNAATNSIGNVLGNHIGGTVQEVINALPVYIKNAAEFAEIQIESFVSETITPEAVETATESIYAAIKDFAVIPASKVVAFIIIYIIVNTVLSIGISFVNNFFKLPILKGLNKTLGAVLGGIKGVFEMYVISAVIGFASMLIPVEEFAEAVSKATLQQGLWETILSFFK